MNPRFPVYIPSKSRADVATTPRVLDEMGVPYRLVIEGSQWKDYRAHFPESKILVRDEKYADEYELCMDLPPDQSKGSGPSRNFLWEHSISEGHEWHWTMDDNILYFGRLHKNTRLRVGDGTIFHAMETFCLRYENVAMAGPIYWWNAVARNKYPPFLTGTRIYSCNLIRNDVPFRWRGRYNEDTILSLDMLKGGWATVQFYAFLQNKMRTQTLKGGNTEAFYAKEGTYEKSDMLVREHPDVARHAKRYGRDHHFVDYSQWYRMPLVRKPGYDLDSEPKYRFTVEPTGKENRRKGDKRFPVELLNG